MSPIRKTFSIPRLEAATASRWRIGAEAWPPRRMSLSPVDLAVTATFALALAIVPAWLGGAEPAAWGFAAIAFPALCAGYELISIAKGGAPAPPAAIGPPLALALAAALFVALQSAQISPDLSLETTISVDPQATRVAFVRVLTVGSAFWLALRLGVNVQVRQAMARAVAITAALYVLVGLVLAIGWANAIPVLAPSDGGGELRATFVNRNAFAAYADIGLMAALGWAADAKSGTRSKGLPPLILALLLAAGVIGTASRGGVLAAGAGAAAWLLLTRASRTRTLAVAFGGASLALGFIWLDGRLAERILRLGFADPARAALYRSAMRMAVARPLGGFGLGAFADAFPSFRDKTMSPVGVYEYAHNAYLDLLVGLGAPFATAMIMAVAWLGAQAARRAAKNEVALGAASAAAALAVDSAVDNPLANLSVALAFAALLGLGVAGSSTRPLPC